MKRCLPAGLFCLTLMANCFGQAVPVSSTVVDEVQSLEMAQRVLQYELMLGSDLNSNVAVCVDEGIVHAWMVPEKADAQVSGKALERVRRRLETCQAGEGNQSQ